MSEDGLLAAFAGFGLITILTRAFGQWRAGAQAGGRGAKP